MGGGERVVIDTNIFVGAGFARESASAAVVRAVREGRLGMPWTEATRGEVESVLRTIPPLDWDEVADLFREEDRVEEPPDEAGLEWVEDPDDRKFAALARSTGAILVSNDEDLLGRRAEAGFPVETPGEYRRARLD